MLPSDIVLKRIALVSQNAHCRFDAVSREYHYLIYDFKNPFMVERGYFYTFKIEIELLEKAAEIANKYELRGYDAVQLASALQANTNRQSLGLSPIIFVSADKELNSVALAENLAVENPNNYP